MECITDQNGNSKQYFVLSFVTGEQQKKVPKKSALVLSVMIELLQAGCAGPPWLCARLQPNSPSIRGRLLEAYHSRARTPGALGCGCMIGQVQCNILYQVLHANYGNNWCIKYFSFESKTAEAGYRSAIRLVRGHRQDVFRSTKERI